MKITTACLFLVAALSLHSNPTVEARPLVKRGCYDGGDVILTNYWVPRQGEKDEDNNGNKMRLSGSKNKAIKDSRGRTIAMVDKNTYKKCDMEGTCVINDHGKDTLINLANDGGSNAKFDIVGKDHPFGDGSDDNALHVFSTVAVNDLPIGTTLYAKELKGMKLPNGLIHNGCLMVGDEGWSFDGCQIDFFVLTYENYLKMNTPEKITTRKQKCKILNYATSEDYKFVGAKVPKNLPKGNRNGGDGGKDNKDDKNNGDNKDNNKDDKKKKTNGGASTKSCDSTDTFVKTYTSTGFEGSETCSAGSGCHNLGDVTKSSKWSGGKATFYKESDCSGEVLYVDEIGEDEDISGNGDGFNAGSVNIE